MIKVITIRIGCYPPFPVCAVPTRKAVEGSRANSDYVKRLPLAIFEKTGEVWPKPSWSLDFRPA
jgi:hypothetical protein